MQIITTIDDLGLHPAVRRAAISLADQGRVTSASLLANGPDRDEALKIHGLGIGVELNVLWGRPCSKQHEVSTLLHQNGRFRCDYAELFQCFLGGKINISQIETEWGAQIEWVLDHGITPTHLTSVRSMHAWPGLMLVAGKLAEKYGIRWVRRPQQCESVLKQEKGRIRTEFMNICTMLQRQPEPVENPDLVWGRDQEEGDGLPESFVRDMQGSEHEVVEVVGRPASWLPGDLPVGDGFEPGPSKAEWGSALACMESEKWQLVFKELGAEHVSFATASRRNG